LEKYGGAQVCQIKGEENLGEQKVVRTGVEFQLLGKKKISEGSTQQ